MMWIVAIAAGVVAPAAVSGLAACGVVTNDITDSGPDALDAAVAVDAAGGRDAAGRSSDASARRCDPDAPISQLRSIEELNTHSFQCCTIQAGDGTAYFTASDSLDYHLGDIYRATVEGDVFSDPVPVIGADTMDARWKPSLSPDGLSLYYGALSQAPGSFFEIQVATRSSADGDFGGGRPVDLGTSIGSADPSITEEGLFFARAPGIHFAARTADGFGPAELVTPLHDEAQRESHPVVSADGRRIYFARTRADGLAPRSIWMAKRESSDPGSPFGLPTPLSIGIENDHYPSWESGDGCELYFTAATQKEPGTYRHELWVGIRDPSG